MAIILSVEHVIDSPADVIAWETSTKLRNVSGTSQGVLKEMYPGYYREAKTHKWDINLKVGSVLVLQTLTTPPGRNKPLVVAGVCINSAAALGRQQRPKDIEACITNLFNWFWQEPHYESLGMSLIGLKATSGVTFPGLIHKHIDLWNKHQDQSPGAERNLYIHSQESNYLAVIKSQPWDGQFYKHKLAYPLYPQFEHS